ncbi:MAG: FAD-binding protein [bacterium]|nr:FAD-binding protein [bacterium]
MNGEENNIIGINGKQVPCVRATVAIVGSGAASLNAALQLSRQGVDDILLVTDRLGGGTSANTGSDKQTYYRVDSAGAEPDSSFEMARELFTGGGMHGDIALVEAALSLFSFYNLVSLGVPFPHDRYGIYAGYKTDHDSKSRGSSAGPRTSIQMYEKLLREVRSKNIPILDKTEVIDLVAGTTAAGLLAIDKTAIQNETYGLVAVEADYIIYGTGGPAALYADSVYPPSQSGSLGIALKKGAVAHNLTESQFGIASVGFRWNLSGSYQQVLPRYVSTKQDGTEAREFLPRFFPSAEQMLLAQFLKGYQWPFDVKKVNDYGSSVIDLLVYYETKVLGRKVYLDFTENPLYKDYLFSIRALPAVAREYLEASNATNDTPVKRLRAMNNPAYEIYLDHGIDLEKDWIEIAVCNQHCNGGLRASSWWESNIENFFPVGECCGTHGIYRPGGSALNSGQVGALRAARYIAEKQKVKKKEKTSEGDNHSLRAGIEKRLEYFSRVCPSGPVGSIGESKINPVVERKKIQERMSRVMGIARSCGEIEKALAENRSMLREHESLSVTSRYELISLLKNEDLLITEQLFLESAAALLPRLKGSRGSSIAGSIEDLFKQDDEEYCVGIKQVSVDDLLNNHILEASYNSSGTVTTDLVPVRPIPETDSWFERVWNDFRSGKVFVDSK